MRMFVFFFSVVVFVYFFFCVCVLFAYLLVFYLLILSFFFLQTTELNESANKLVSEMTKLADSDKLPSNKNWKYVADIQATINQKQNDWVCFSFRSVFLFFVCFLLNNIKTQTQTQTQTQTHNKQTTKVWDDFVLPLMDASINERSALIPFSDKVKESIKKYEDEAKKLLSQRKKARGNKADEVRKNKIIVIYHKVKESIKKYEDEAKKLLSQRKKARENKQ
jgi:hypothetical protein